MLITGGVGFIGSNLAIRLVDCGARVSLIDSMLPQYGAILSNIDPVRDRVHVNFSDVRDRHTLPYLVRDQEVIFSLAGQVSHSDSMLDPLTDLDINCASQLALLEACRENNPGARVVSASTRQLYGRPQYLPVDENHPLNPVDVNGINKLASEYYYTLYHQVYGLHTVSLRLTNTYGPRMDVRSLNKGFVGIFVQRAMRGESIKVFGDGQQRRDFNFVDDVVDALLLAAEDGELAGQVFNLGHPEPRTLLEFVEILREIVAFEYSLVPFPDQAKAIDIGDYYGSFEKFHAATGWSPKTDLREGLEATIRYLSDTSD